jgi:aminopeptidase N
MVVTTLLWGVLHSVAAAPLRPDPRGLARPDRPFDAERLTLEVTLHPEERAVEGVARWLLRRQSAGPLVLDQIALDIQSVTVGGDPVQWWTRPGQLVVPLEGQEAVELELRWRATPETGVHFRSADRGDAYDEIYTQGQHADHRHWLPLVDHPGDRFAYAGTVNAPSGWTAVTNSGDDLEGYLLMFAAGRYDTVAHATDDRFVVRVPPGSSPEAVAPVLDPLPAMVAHLESRTGAAYPWGDYHQTFVQRFLYFGMENTGQTINSADALLDARVQATRPRVEALVLHELAHQWFGDLLTCRSWQDLWLNEGFARYMEADWWQATRGEARYAEEVLQWHTSARFDRPLAGRFFHGRGHPQRGQVYVAGASVLHALRMHLGEEAFWAGIQRYVARHAHGHVETRDLQRAMEDGTGRNLDWFFQQWVELGVKPVVQATVIEGSDELKVRLRQVPGKAARPELVLPVRVVVAPEGGPPIGAEGWLEDGVLELKLPVSGAPRWVAVDPEGALPMVLKQEAPPARLAALAGDAGAPPYARLRAVRQLADTDESGALVDILVGSGPPALRRAAARALGQQRAAAALLEHVEDADGSVRLEVVTGLGRCAGDEVAAALRTLARSEPNPDIQAAALSGLRAVDPERALTIARRLAVPGDRETDRRTSAALKVVGALGGPSDMRRLLQPMPRRLRRDGLRAAARLALSQDSDAARDRLSAQVARVAEQHLWDDDLRTRQAVVEVLREVGDVRSEPLLARAQRETVLLGHEAAIRRALQHIRGRETPPQRVAPNAVEARIQELEDRLDALEAEERHVHGP